MIREMVRALAGGQNLGSTTRRPRRFQPGLGLAIEGLELRLAPSGLGMGMGMGPAPAAEQATTANGSTGVTVTNQDGGTATGTSSGDDQGMGWTTKTDVIDNVC